MRDIPKLLFAIAIQLAAAFLSPSASASGYTLKTLYTFCVQSGCPDGQFPEAGVVIDATNVIYGTTASGGKFGAGALFSLTPHGGTYKQKVLHSFCNQNCTDGAIPFDLIEDEKGNLYGTTEEVDGGAGTIFSLTRTAHGWRFKTIYTFCSQVNCTDGGIPMSGLSYKGQASGKQWDGKSPLFGSLSAGGSHANGAIFKLQLKNGHWAYNVIHNIQTGVLPGPVLVDHDGNLFIASFGGGANGGGNLYMLASGTWKETTIHNFCAQGGCVDGANPSGRLALDTDGNVFGVTFSGGNANTGVAYEHPASGGFAVIYTFCGDGSCGNEPNSLSFGQVSHDLLGTTNEGGATNSGLVFALTFKNGTWSEKVIHDFCADGNCSSGSQPEAAVFEDAAGIIFGTTAGGGNVSCEGGGGGGCGTVFRLKP